MLQALALDLRPSILGSGSIPDHYLGGPPQRTHLSCTLKPASCHTVSDISQIWRLPSILPLEGVETKPTVQGEKGSESRLEGPLKVWTPDSTPRTLSALLVAGVVSTSFPPPQLGQTLS